MVILTDDLLPFQVRPEDLWYSHRTVLVLVIVQDGDHGPGERDSRAVQRVHELAFQMRLPPELDHRPSCLELLEIAARGDFQPLVHGRGVALNVVCLRGEEFRVRTAQWLD